MQAIKTYSMRVDMLCRLYDLKLINNKEYTKIKNRLENQLNRIISQERKLVDLHLEDSID